MVDQKIFYAVGLVAAVVICVGIYMYRKRQMDSFLAPGSFQTNSSSSPGFIPQGWKYNQSNLFIPQQDLNVEHIHMFYGSSLQDCYNKAMVLDMNVNGIEFINEPEEVSKCRITDAASGTYNRPSKYVESLYRS